MHDSSLFIYTYLKDPEYYSDLYDQGTIDECKRIIKDAVPLITDLWLHFAKGERYIGKAAKIKEWMDRDTTLDQRLRSVAIPKRYCDQCGGDMQCEDISYHWKGYDRILLMYACPDCSRRRAWFDTTEEYIPKHECVMCSRPTLTKTTTKENDTVTITDTCSSCGHIESHTYESGKETPEEKQEKELIRRQFIADREKYCLTDMQGQDYLKEKEGLDRLKELVDKHKDDEKNAVVNARVEQMQKLTISEVEKLISSSIEKAQYVKLQLSSPEIEKDVIVPFGVYDDQKNRTAQSSAYDLKKIIKKTLKDTNWRLMSEGVSYRMGYLSGRLRGYDKKEDWIVLVSSGDEVKL